MTSKNIYFPNLNGLRFLAAFLVIIHHIEQFKYIFHLNTLWESSPFIKLVGKLGVVLFFVLSGFLITYLLLYETKKSNSISVKKFYLRRLLRIWPLYFLIITFSFFIAPNIEFFNIEGYDKNLIYSNLPLKLLVFGLFFPNLAYGLFGIIPYASHTWSIGTEEQFYLLWPLILKFYKKSKLQIMYIVIVLYLFVKTLLHLNFLNFIPHKHILVEFWLNFNIDCMAIGGFFAVILYQKRKVLSFLININLFYITLIILFLLFFNGIHFSYFHFEIYSILFGIIILNFSSNNKIHISLENNFFNYLGKISYGIYMYHPIGIIASIKILLFLNLYSNWTVLILTLLITIGLSSISYKFFESYFLKFKKKFTVVISGIK